ncbi:DUF1746-domain-containing protein [Lentithecium fluviatile CBS 122367]|uniref:DUF1746-domain-containing protein n=1 Tax=Lentithecium fluviatile CBS 122367 TaxID=1168545 RepID=A0A6G1ITF5_9PLEO|nr:DUF1746-domain-containing protein [Lentithecium fluviatile CBS 122367]
MVNERARHAGQRHGDTNDADDHDEHDGATEDLEIDEEMNAAEREKQVKERRKDAKRKRVVFLDHLLRELDTLVFLELITLYHMDCSFFWFTLRALIHGSLLTPLPDIGLSRPLDEHKPFLPLILFCFVVNFFLHLTYPAPSAGEDTRGYLHGGLMIDFIGQKGPTSKWKLVGLDLALLLLQMTMVAVHAKRRELKKKLANMSGGSVSSATRTAESEAAATPAEQATTAEENAAREQDADAEERGVLRRTDTLSDIGGDLEEEDTLLPHSEAGHVDALDILISGQCVIGEFTLVDTLLQEHEHYQAYRQTRTDGGASSSIPPSTLRQLHSIRMRFGVGGG